VPRLRKDRVARTAPQRVRDDESGVNYSSSRKGFSCCRSAKSRRGTFRSPLPKETLIKFFLSTARSDKVAPDELANQAEDTGDDDGL
jgi:hypothetical protein